MTKQSLRVSAGILCLLPAIELGSPPLVLPTFVPGCELIPPTLKSVYMGKGQPIARPRFAHIDVFLAGNQPQRPYVVVGEVEVLTKNRNTSLRNLIEYASREARKLGGDAIVDVRPRDLSTDPQRSRILTARVVSWIVGPSTWRPAAGTTISLRGWAWPRT